MHEARAVAILTRKDLIEALRTVKPALSSRNEVLSGFCFTSKTVMACNGLIAISVPCETDFAGAVTRKLLDILNRGSKRHSVELAASAGELVWKEAELHFRLPLRPPEEFQALFTMPTMPNDVAKLTERESSDLLRCIAGCMRSLGSNSYDSDQLGVTVIPNGKGVEMFATNARTLSKASLDIDLTCKRRVIIPAALCRQALAIGKRAKSLRLRIADDHALMVADDVTLLGGFLASEKPYDFEKVLNDHFPRRLRKQTVPIPKDLRSALERAFIVVGKRVASEFFAEDGYLTITSQSETGEVRDQLEFEAPKGGVKAHFEPELLLAGTDDFDRMLITPTSCVMTNKRGDFYLVAASVR
jgi:DNA polymerase III sliding clamp (beta) subunit (PCNA family)